MHKERERGSVPKAAELKLTEEIRAKIKKLLEGEMPSYSQVFCISSRCDRVMFLVSMIILKHPEEFAEDGTITTAAVHEILKSHYSLVDERSLRLFCNDMTFFGVRRCRRAVPGFTSSFKNTLLVDQFPEWSGFLQECRVQLTTPGVS